MQKHIECGIAGRSIGPDYLTWIEKLAGELGIQGATMMNHDGSVKVIAEGEEEDLEEFVERLKSETPHEVYNFYVKWSKTIAGLENFIILNN